MFLNNKGFTIIEVFLGVTIFLIGLLGVAALQISSIRAEAFSSRISEATMLARTTFEELMAISYDDARLADTDGGGFDADMTTDRKVDLLPAGGNKKPDAFDIADHNDRDGVGTNTIFGVGWSVCEDCLLEDTKTVRVIVYWQVKGEPEAIDFFGLIPRS